MPPCRLMRIFFWKFDYEMVHSEVYLNKYVVSIAPFPQPPFRKLLFFTCFRFLIFIHFLQGVCGYACTLHAKQKQTWIRNRGYVTAAHIFCVCWLPSASGRCDLERGLSSHYFNVVCLYKMPLIERNCCDSVILNFWSLIWLTSRISGTVYPYFWTYPFLLFSFSFSTF